MTQPALEQPVIDVPAVPNGIERSITSQQLADKIREKSGLSAAEMDLLRRAVRLGGWQVGKAVPHPDYAAYTVHTMFIGSGGDRTDDHMPGDTRVYATPASLVDPAGELNPFLRFVINRVENRTVNRIDAMNLAAFIEDVAFEYSECVVEEEEEEEEDEPEEEPVNCISCDAEISPSDKHCSECGEKQPRKCGACEAELEPEQKFCGSCGVPVPPASIAR